MWQRRATPTPPPPPEANKQILQLNLQVVLPKITNCNLSSCKQFRFLASVTHMHGHNLWMAFLFPPVITIHCWVILCAFNNIRNCDLSPNIMLWADISKHCSSSWRGYLIQMVVTLNKTQHIQFPYTHKSTHSDWKGAVLCDWLVHCLLFQYFIVMAKMCVSK